MKYRLYILTIISFLFFISSCENKKKEVPKQEEKVIETPEIKEVEPVEVEKETPPAPVKPKKKKRKPGLLFLEDLVGKYPAKDGIFKDKYLKKRIEKIKGLNYALMMQNWNNETPLVREGDVIHSSGCMKSHCPNGAYELFIDLKNNNINIYYFNQNSLRIYTEKGWIKLPPGFKKELEKKQELAKIGSTSDDMESKYRLKVR